MLRTTAALAAAALCAASFASAAFSPLFATSETASFVEIDPTTGKTVRTILAETGELQAQNLAAIDTKKGIYYLLGYNAYSQKPNLIGVSVDSASEGKVVCNQTLPFAESSFIGVGQQVMVDSVSGQVYLGGLLQTGGNHTVGSFDCASGKYKVIAEMPSTDLPVLGAGQTFIESSRSLLIQLGSDNSISNFLIDVDTGKVTTVPEDPQEGRILTTVQYDSKHDKVVGLGIHTNSTGGLVRTVVNLDPKTLKYTTVGTIPTYVIESGGESALDLSNDRLTWIGCPMPQGKTLPPMHLITVEASTGAVLTAPILCEEDAECPWTINYRN